MPSFILLLFYLSLAVSAGFFAYAAVEDFRVWKIRHNTIFALIGLYIVTAAIGLSTQAMQAAELVDPLRDLGAGALLFAIGFGMWAFKALGGGDAKLMFPLGLFTGWDHLLLFAIGLVLFALVAVIGLRLPFLNAFGHTRIGLRLLEIRDSRKFPYAVVMVAALYLVIYVKYVSGLL